MNAGRPDDMDLVAGLLDRQVIDEQGRMVCKVDDLEFEETPEGVFVSAILVGPAALGPRLGGLLGRIAVAIHRGYGARATPEPPRIPMSRVLRIGSAVEVTEDADEAGIGAAEVWTRDHIIRHIPGAGHAGE